MSRPLARLGIVGARHEPGADELGAPGPTSAAAEAPHPVDELRAYLAESRKHLDGLARTMREQTAPGVLETATITIPATGALERSYRIPYAAVAALNLSAGDVVITSAATQASAPGGGQGQQQIPARSFLAFNMSGQTITFYGQPGAIITYSVLVNRIQPAAAINPIIPVGPVPVAGTNATFAAAAAASATLPAGSTLTGFDVTLSAAAAVGVASVTVTGVVGATYTYTVQEETSGGAILSIRFPGGGLPASSPSSVPTVSIGAVTSGGSGDINIFGTTPGGPGPQ